MKCMVCGGEITPESRFCKYCGVPVVKNEISNSDNGAVENRIELTDEDGNSVYFEFLDLVTYRGKEYVILLPEDDNADEVIILQVESLSDENESYIAVENQQILETVFEIFKERNRDFFTFTD